MASVTRKVGISFRTHNTREPIVVVGAIVEAIEAIIAVLAALVYLSLTSDEAIDGIDFRMFPEESLQAKLSNERRTKVKHHICKFLNCILVAMLFLTACGLESTDAPVEEVPTEEEATVEKPAPSEESVLVTPIPQRKSIIGPEDWDDIAKHTAQRDPRYPHAYSNSKGVAQVLISDAKDSICTGFLIGRHVLMTADHCVRNDSGKLLDTATIKAVFGLERNVDTGIIPNGDTYDCSNILDAAPTFDLAVLHCQPNNRDEFPGDNWSVVPLTRDGPSNGNDLYVISVNCWVGQHIDPNDMELGCRSNTQRLLFSPGSTKDSTERRDSCEVGDADDTFRGEFLGKERHGFEHNCDTLPGSSGAPVFHRKTGVVWGIVSGSNWWFGDINRAGAVWKYVRNNDDNSNNTIDFLENITTDGCTNFENKAVADAHQAELEGDYAWLEAHGYVKTDHHYSDEQCYPLKEWEPADEDSDGDGLSNYFELNFYSLDPTDPDMDRDGLLDGYELEESGTSYLHVDSDYDGREDKIEDDWWRSLSEDEQKQALSSDLGCGPVNYYGHQTPPHAAACKNIFPP